MSNHPSTAYAALRAQRLSQATKPFKARGVSVKRCTACLVAEFACICQWRVSVSAQVDFVLLMHSHEIFKPTNTGRLLADVLPSNTHAFCWSRTTPEADLLAMLQDPTRFCVLLYPAAEETDRKVFTALPKTNCQKLTVVLLDGTWKQARRMFHQSAWLRSVPALSLQVSNAAQYAARKAVQPTWLSTAEAAASVLSTQGECDAAKVLQDYFSVFNEACLATRGSRLPIQTAAHERLALRQL